MTKLNKFRSNQYHAHSCKNLNMKSLYFSIFSKLCNLTFLLTACKAKMRYLSHLTNYSELTYDNEVGFINYSLSSKTSINAFDDFVGR